MKKVLFVLVVMALFGCTSNKIVGTWVSVDSENSGDKVSVGMIGRVTYNSDGTLEERYALQANIDGDAKDAAFVLIGKWEMPDKETLLVHMEKCKMGTEEMENIKDVKYEVIEVNDNNLVLMTGGKEYKYRRNQ